MTVTRALNKAKDEVKKVFKTKKLSPSLASAFIALIIAFFEWVKKIFFSTYNFVFTKLNSVLPLPFVSKYIKDPQNKKEQKEQKERKEQKEKVPEQKVSTKFKQQSTKKKV